MGFRFKKMNILFVRGPLTLSKYASAAPAVPPIGMAYIAAALIENNHKVKVVDVIGQAINEYYPYEEKTLYRGLSFDQIIDEIDQDYDVIALSVMFSQDWPLTIDLINLLKKRLPKAIVIAGGEHITAEPEGSLVSCEHLDICVLGEGEHTVIDVIQNLDNLHDVGGIYFKDSDRRVVKGNLSVRNRNPETFPWPAWDLFPMENYLSEGHGWGVNRGRSMPIIASRGCPYQCTFCSNPFMWTTRWVARPVEDVITEMKFYIKKYKAENFDFQDLTAIVKKQWIKLFCERLIEENLNVTWQLPTGTRTEAIDDEVAKLLMKSGCRNITYAPESGSEEVLIRIKKKIKLQHVYDSAKSCYKAGLDVKFNFIYGFPEDTFKNFFETTIFTIRLAILGISDISIAPFSPYPGSELFFQLQKEGKIPKKLDMDYYKNIPFSDMSATVSWCETFDSKQLNRARNITMIIFYFFSYLFHPSRPFKRIYNFINNIEETRMDKALGDMKRRKKNLSSNKPSPKSDAVRPF